VRDSFKATRRYRRFRGRRTTARRLAAPESWGSPDVETDLSRAFGIEFAAVWRNASSSRSKMTKTSLPSRVSSAPPPRCPPVEVSTMGSPAASFIDLTKSQARRYDIPMARAAALMLRVRSIPTSNSARPRPSKTCPPHSTQQRTPTVSSRRFDRRSEVPISFRLAATRSVAS
jgi:hypothetical protein